jgi:CheY-like chemotaxis protein
MISRTILIVEDNPVNRKLLVTVLRPHGYKLLSAVDGEEAVRIARQELPDLILMDLQLPKMNGFEATQRLKELPETANIPVIALTAHAMPDERHRAQQVGFDGYITKPIDTRTFPNQIRAVFEQARSLDDLDLRS